MNPRLMLSLWRERWGKAAGTTFKVPYARGKINQWTHWLPYSGVWSFKGVYAFAMLSCILLMGLMMGIGLSLNSQILFSVLLVCIALYVRRYAGTLITLVLVGMAVIATTRYLYWRLDATLVRDFSIDFLFGFYLFVAECYLALLVFIGLIQSIWPLKRVRVSLPGAQDEWPTVDVLVLCHDQPYAAIKLTSMAAYNLEWPRKKIKTYLIDGGQRDDLQALAESIGAHYLPHVDESGSHADFINRTLPSIAGELIAVFECGQAPAKGFLQSTTGWFLRDPKLGLAHTPQHFLAPAASHQDIESVNSTDPSESCVVLRRSTLLEVGGINASPVTEKSHTALTLQAAGYSSAYIGFVRRADISHQNQNVIVEPTINPVPEIFLVEHPFFGHTLLWKQRIASVHRVLQFYYPVPRLLFFTAPVVYLLGHVQIIQTSPELLAAYALPHFVHAHIARTRTHGPDRFTLVADIRETVLAWYMLVPTTLTLLRTGFSQCVGLLTVDKLDKPEQTRNTDPTTTAALIVVLPYMCVLALNLAGFFTGMAQVLFSGTSHREVATLYLLWTVYNLMLLAAMLAVAEEAKQVLKHTRMRLHMPAMIKLPSGRTVSCATENFPAPLLELSLPMPVAVDTGSPVSISIFHGHRELVFPATVVLRQDLMLGVGIVEAAQNDYRTFAVAVLSRGPEWPKLLPGRTADRPFPKWVTDAFVAVPIAILDFATNISKHLHWVRLDSWIQLWKKRND